MDEQKLLFSLIRTVICNEKPDSVLQAACTPELLERTYTLAKHHDLAHIMGQAVSAVELPPYDIVTVIRQAAFTAAIRDARRSHDFSQLCQTLEAAACPFIPLKGSVLCRYYPQPWMRTSCDIDILVQEAELERVAGILVDRLGYRYVKKTSHDISLISQGNVCLELHYSTIEDAVSPSASRILEDIWEQAKPVEAGHFHMEIPDSLFYFYHMAHMAKHFINGGCGLRTVLDTWILENRVPHDARKRRQLLQKGGLFAFAQAAEKLSRIWFEGEETDRLSDEMAQYILSGGTYGTVNNKVSIHQQKKGGKLGYALSRIFLPYDIIKYHYPVLMKHKVLLPVFQVVRWGKLLFCGGVGRSVKELKSNATLSAEEGETARTLLGYLGLE